MLNVRIIIAGLTLAVSGCATTNGILANEAEEVFHTAHPPREVVSCFEMLNRIRVIERPDGTRVAVFRNTYGGVAKTFSITSEGTGSRIETRHNFVVAPGLKWQRCVGLKPMPAVITTSTAERGA